MNTGLTEKLSGGGDAHRMSEGLPNRSNIEIGDQFAPMQVVTIDGDTTTIPHGDATGNRVYAFLSGTCEPCLMIAKDMVTWESVNSGELEVVVLSESPDVYDDHAQFAVYDAPFMTLENLGIRAFPTVVLVDGAGTVKAVMSGYSKMMTEERFVEYFLGYPAS